MQHYKIIISGAALKKIEQYQTALCSGAVTAGRKLAHQVAQHGGVLSALSTENFLDLLLETKQPRIFAESEIAGGGHDWNDHELSILGHVNVSADVKVFDNGTWSPKDPHFKTHVPPLDATLLFSPGALLAKGAAFNGDTPDMKEVAPNGVIDRHAYRALVERRLLPLLQHADMKAGQENIRAVVTVPGIGAGVFAGRFSGQMGAHLDDALQFMLDKHAAQLPNIAMVYYDPFAECANDDKVFSSVQYRTRPQKYNAGKPQLCAPQDYAEGRDDFRACRLFKIVAWDHVSLPGNDYFVGDRHTDDGVAAAATDVMTAITGIKGSGYDAASGKYLPPQGCATWEEAALQNAVALTASGQMEVYSPQLSVPLKPPSRKLGP